MVRAWCVEGGCATGTKPGSGGGGLPLAMQTTEANRHDSTQLLALVDAVPPVAGKPGAPRRKFAAILTDRAYDSQPLREALWQRDIVPFLARRDE